jgi:hypothetical protein
MPVPSGGSLGDSQLSSGRPLGDLSSAASIQDEGRLTRYVLAAALGLQQNLALNSWPGCGAGICRRAAARGNRTCPTAELVVGALKKIQGGSRRTGVRSGTACTPDNAAGGDQSASSSAAEHLTRT